MNTASHTQVADTIQTEIYRRMAPAARLTQAVRMNRQMRSLMDAGLRAEQPGLSAEQRQSIIAERILHARTG